MHFLYQNGQMGVVLEIFVNGYPTWVKTPLCFGLVNYSISSSEDEDVRDDLSEVITNEYVQDKPIEIERYDKLITDESVHDKPNEAEKKIQNYQTCLPPN